MNTKGQPFHVQLTQGHRHEATVASELLSKSRGKAFIADAGYDSNALIDEARAKGFKAVICPNRSRKWYRLKLDKKLYAKRFRVGMKPLGGLFCQVTDVEPEFLRPNVDLVLHVGDVARISNLWIKPFQ